MADEKGPSRPPPKTVTETGTLFRTSLRPFVAPAASATATATGSTDSAVPSSSGWQVTNPSQWNGEERAALVEGSSLKQRFVLERVVGKGGMGTVFCARDVRKEEAQDRFPYVAVKVLNEDFKRHPESLKLLQREARKAQQLAHPNIVAVHDFDRDGPNVFIVMELLQGESLDRVIKQTNNKGLATSDALRIVSQLGNALGYAHQKGVIHLDFKPANAYVCKDDTVKILDFGIAQAQQREDASDTDQTRLQVSDLGALTPSYASIEMLDGGDPDPRDDIYALACVTYELLTGKHPFGRQPAQFALEYKLSPSRPRGLSRARWQGLQRGLALKREDRTPSVAEFVAEVTTVRTSPALRWGIAAAALALTIGAIVHWQLRFQVGTPSTRPVPAMQSNAVEASEPANAGVAVQAATGAQPSLPSPAVPAAVQSAAELEEHQRKRLRRLAAENDIAAATEVLSELREELPPGDPFVTDEAPEAIAAANLRLADRALIKADFSASSDFVRAAQLLRPGSAGVHRATDAIEAMTRLDSTVRTGRVAAETLTPSLSILKSATPNSYAALERNLASVLAARIQREQRSSPGTAQSMLAVALDLFGHVPSIAALRPTALKPESAPQIAQPNPSVQTPPPQQVVAESAAPVQQPQTQQKPPVQPVEAEKPKKRDRPNVIVTF